MSSHNRPQRVGDMIRTELSTLLLREVRDPGVQNVTVTRVQMSKDLEHARVYYTEPAGSDARTARRANLAVANLGEFHEAPH